MQIKTNFQAYISILFVFLVLSFFGGCNAKNQATQAVRTDRSPNVIIIFVDDMGYGDIGAYGHPSIQTPNLDQMAAEGCKFTQFYVGASVCTPSRAALLTGRLPIRYGMVSDKTRVLFPFSFQGIPQSEITLAEALKEQGYATSIVGKWHLGHLTQFLPTNHGFDSYFGIPYSNDMGRDTSSHWKPKKKYPLLPLMKDTNILELDVDQHNLTKRYTQNATDFIKAQKEQPFFLYMAHSFPHIPLFASQDFAGKSSRGLYGDVIEELDWSVGEILNTLKAEGLEKNTFVFFTSDNGPWLVMKEEGGSAGLLREGKGCTWEGGMRVPAIAWWPGKIEAGKTEPAMATTMDLHATALELGGANIPSDRIMDGKSLLPLLEGKTGKIRDEVYYYLGEQLFAIRKGPWKMHFKTLTPYVGEQAVVHDPPLLYHLDRDPSEQYTVAEKHADIVAELKQAAEQHLATVKAVPSLLEDIDQSYFE